MAVLLALCSVLLGLIVIALLTGSGRAGPLPHPEFGPMQTGVDAGELGAPAWASYVAGIAVLGAMWVVMLIGLRRGHWIHRAVNAWMVGYVFLFVILMWTFGVYAAGETTILLGFTAPTSLLVYGLGLPRGSRSSRSPERSRTRTSGPGIRPDSTRSWRRRKTGGDPPRAAGTSGRWRNTGP